MVGFGKAVSLVFLSLGLTCCAVLRDEDRFDTKDVVDPWNYQKSLKGRSKSRVRPGKFLFQMEGIKTLAKDLHADGAQVGWRMVQDAPMSVAGAAVPVSDEVRLILGARPRVECAEDAVSLKLHGAPAAYESGLFIDQDAGPPLPLSKVPSGCGVQVHRKWWGLILTVPFVGCFGAPESDAYTLPIHLSGLPAKLSCPLTSLESKPFSANCNSSGMTVKTPKATRVDNLWVNVKNKWLPVLKAAVRCNFNVMSESDGLVLSSPYEPCLESKHGIYSIKIATEKEIQLFCPASQPSSSPPPTDLGHEPGPVDAGASKLSSSPLLEGAQPTMVPTSSLPFGPVADLPNAGGIPSLSSNQPMAPTTKSPLETGPEVNRPIEAVSLDLEISPSIQTSSPLEHGLVSNLPNGAHDSVWATGQQMVPTTSLPAAHNPGDTWLYTGLTQSSGGLPNEMPTTGSPVARLPFNLGEAPLTSLAGLPNKMPTTGLPLARLPFNLVDALLTPVLAGLPNDMPTTGSPLARLPFNLVDAPLTPVLADLPTKMPMTGSPVTCLLVANLVDGPLTTTSAGFPNKMPTTGSPVARLPFNLVDSPLTPSSAGLPNEMATTGSPVACLPFNLVDAPLTPSLAGLQPTKMPTTSELATTTMTSSPQRVYVKPQQPYSSKPWYPVYLQKPVHVPVGASDEPELPESSSDADDSQVLPFPGPVPPYNMNPFMYFNPVLMSGANHDPRPYWLNQPYFHGPQFPMSSTVFGPNFFPSPSLPCKDQSCVLENHASPSTSSNMGGASPLVSSTTPVGQAKSAKPKGTPLKIIKSKFF